MEGLQVGAQFRDAQSGYVLHHVAPVGPDVGKSARGSVGRFLDAPVPIRVVQQPVLRVGALHGQDIAELARLPQAAHILHQGIEAQVLEGAVGQALLFG